MDKDYEHKKMRKSIFILSFLLAVFTVPAYAVTDFEHPKMTLDKLYENNQSTEKSGYRFSFSPLLLNEYNTLASPRKFIRYTSDESNNISPSYYTYSYTPNNFLDFTSTLNRTDLTGHAFNIRSLYDKSMLFSVVDTSSIPNPITFTDYDFKIPQVSYGDETYTYYKINYSEVASQAANKATANLIYPTTSHELHFYGLQNSALFATSGNIQNVYGDFIRNKNTTTTQTSGAAIHLLNSGAGTIIGDFIQNQSNLTAGSGFAYGGAVYSLGSPIDKIIGNFIGNSIVSTTYSGQGGAVYMRGTTILNLLEGDFIGNYIDTTLSAFGGALGTDAKITTLKGSYIANHATGKVSGQGGAIYNRGGLGNITGHFIGNYAQGGTGRGEGGAIYNYDTTTTIGDITGDFVGNSTKANVDDVGGGAIYNYLAKIDNIKGDFINNHITGNRNVQGGAIYSYEVSSYIASITGDFINNYANYTGTYSYIKPKGGAIHVGLGEIGNITGNFIGNFIESTMGDTQGGALYSSDATIGKIEGDFISNHLKSESGAVFGGAVYATGTSTKKIDIIKGNFSGNYAHSVKESAKGGAIYISGDGEKISSIEGDFVNNYALSETAGKEVKGGAIAIDKGTIKKISGKFIGNYITSKGSALGGAISVSNTGTKVETIEGHFINNRITLSSSSSAQGGAVVVASATIDNLLADFTGNSSYGSAQAYAYGGALYMSNNSHIGKVQGNFSNNYALSDGRDAKGGAISTTSLIDHISGSFKNNYAEAKNVSYIALGGAIYSTTNLSLESNKKSIEFTGNYTKRGTTKTYNAIFLDTGTTNDRKISMLVEKDGKITFNDEISGGRVSGQSITYDKTYTINITGEKEAAGTPAGEVAFNASVINAQNVNVKDATLKLGSYNHGDSSATNNYGHGLFVAGTGTNPFTNLSLDNSTLHLNYATYQTLNLASISSTNNASLIFGANFETGLSDKIYATTANNAQSINLRAITVNGKVSLGQEVNLFGNTTSGYLNVGNIDDFVLVYDGKKYGLEYDKGTLKIAKDLGVVYPLYIKESTSVGIDTTTLDGASTEGVIVNDYVGTITNSNFKNNANNGNATSTSGDGGVALNNSDLMVIGSNFEGNSAKGNGAVIANNTGGILSITNSNFSGNSAQNLGGAIYSSENITISATNSTNSSFSNNTHQSGVANDVYIDSGKTLNLNASDNGTLSFNSGLDGNNYKINVSGNDNGNINLNSAANNLSSLTMSGGNLNVLQNSYIQNADVELISGNLNFANGNIGDILLSSLKSSGGMMSINFSPATATADKLKIAGDLNGTVSLVLNALDTSKTNEKIVFAETPNDDQNTTGGFSIYRTMGSPYEWFTNFESSSNSWYINTAQDTTVKNVSSEVISYLSMISASIEQTRSIKNSIRSQTAINKPEVVNCELTYNGRTCNRKEVLNSWVTPVYYTSNQHSPTHMKSDVSGFDGGFDLQRDLYNKLGLLVSFRRGTHELDGKAPKFHSSFPSDIHMNSYLAGLYYRRDKNNYWLSGAIYGGLLKADIKTHDQLKTDGNGFQMTTDVEFGHLQDLSKTWTLAKSIGVSYTYLNWDKLEDNYGKQAKYDATSYAEIDTSLTFEKRFMIGERQTTFYLKPSIIQTLTVNDNIYITGLEKSQGNHDRLLGRLETGGKIFLNNKLSTYGSLGYTAGNKYDAFTASLGLNYNW